MQTDSSIHEEASVGKPVSRRRSFRWRIIPGVYHTLFAAFGLLGCAFHISAVAFYNLKFGWIKFDAQNRSLSQLAITPINVTIWQFTFWAFVISGFAAYFWFRAAWRRACLSSVTFFSLMLAARWLETLAQKG